LTGKELEEFVVLSGNRYPDSRLDVWRNGTQSSVGPNGQVIQHKSKPDFEVTLANDGIRGTFDAKSCSEASFPLNDFHPDKKSSRALQLSHMFRVRARGGYAFFLIHKNRREMKAKADVESQTWLFPVTPNWFWDGFYANEIRRVTQMHLEELGVPVEWWMSSERARKPTMRLDEAIRELRSRL